MSPDSILYQVFNNRSQPVELHFGQQVVVIPPNGMLELNDAALAAEQVQHLRHSGAITVHALPFEPAAPLEEHKESKHKDKPEKAHNHADESKKKKNKK